MLRQLCSEIDLIDIIQPKDHIYGRIEQGALNQSQEQQLIENRTITQAEMDVIKLRLEQSVTEASRLQNLMEQMDELFPRYDFFSANITG